MAVQILNHPLYSETVSNLDRTVIRDKLARIVQYFSRFLSYYALRKGYSAQIVAQLKSVTSYFSASRKIFRLGKPIGLFRAFVRELSNHTKSPVAHYTNLGRNLGQFGFLTLDAVQLFKIIGVYRPTPATFKRIQDYTNRFWMVTMISNIIDSGHASYIETLRIKALLKDEKASPEEVKRAVADRKKQLIVLIWNLVDLIIPLSNLGYINGNDGIIGLAGTFTAYIGLTQAW